MEEGWTNEALFKRFRRGQGLSIVKRGLTWYQVRGLSHEEVLGLTEGEDYFIGGFHYDIPQSLYDELDSAGMT